MRWTYLIPRFIIVALIWAFFTFGFDPLLRYGAVQSMQSVTGARADIDSLRTGFFPPQINVGGVALASQQKPGTNLVQFDQMTLHLAGDALLRQSYVIEEATMTGVRFGTPRTDRGQLEAVEEESSGPMVPPWLQDRLTNLGDEWLDEITRQAKQQLDPNQSESYRVGNEVYAKWDGRFDQFEIQIKNARAKVEGLKRQIELAKQAPAIEQVEQYLQAAQNADLLFRESQTIAQQLQTSALAEIKHDIARLDQAQKNDRARIAQTVNMLKPDGRQITESLIGEEMYLQLQKMLTWVETIRDYQQQIKAPAPPERYRGRDIEFPLFNPTPKVLCRKMLINGELVLDDVPTPFQGSLTDVTSNPQLHGIPAQLHVSTSGDLPIEFVIRHDATTDVAQTTLAANYVDRSSQQLMAGKEGSDRFTAELNNTEWNAQLALTEGNIKGRILIRSDFSEPAFHSDSQLGTALAGLTQETFAGISQVSATLELDGPVKRPSVSVSSDLGQQISEGFQTGFAAFVPQVRAQMTAMVDQYVAGKKQEINQKLGIRYSGLLADHKKAVDALQDARQIVADLRSGRVDPNRVFRMASDSGLLKEDDQQKVDKYKSKADEVLKGLDDPGQTIQDALPGLSRRLFR